eukprot:scaffold39546_cov62-Attheya_sp.AAC.3
MEKIVLRKRSTRRGVGVAFTIGCLLVLSQLLVLAVMSLTPVFTLMTRYGTRPAASLVAFVAHQRNDPSMIRQNEYHERKQTRLHAIEGLLGNQHPHGEPFSSNEENEENENDNKHPVVFEIHEETNEELLLSEEAAAQDAHDCSDPGMEAAAMERAVMLAAQLAHSKTEEMASSMDDDDDV